MGAIGGWMFLFSKLDLQNSGRVNPLSPKLIHTSQKDASHHTSDGFTLAGYLTPSNYYKKPEIDPPSLEGDGQPNSIILVIRHPFVISPNPETQVFY